MINNYKLQRENTVIHQYKLGNGWNMQNFENALIISASGISLVFLGIIILWGLMVLLVRLPFKQKGEKMTSNISNREGKKEKELKKQAIAAAVVTAICLQDTSLITSVHQQQEKISPWQAVHRSRQLNKIIHKIKR